MSQEQLPLVPFDRATHEAGLHRFLQKVLDEETFARRARVLDWIHDAMPGRDRAPIRFVIMDGDNVAASMGHLPADFLVKGERVAARFTHDLLVDPDYRGRGLAKQIVENAPNTGDFLPGGMWMTGACYKIHLACGFDDAPALTTHTLVLDPDAFLARKELSAFKSAVSAAALKLSRARALKQARDSLTGDGVELIAAKEFDAGHDGAWLELLKTYGIARLRESEWLNWKYARHPLLDYRVMLARRNGRPAGYVVWRFGPEAGEKRTVIPDFLVANGDTDLLRHLIAKVIVDSADAGMEAVSILSTQPWAVKLLRGLGFFPRGARHSWVVANWKGLVPAEWLTDVSAWHMCMGDSDGDLWTGSQ